MNIDDRGTLPTGAEDLGVSNEFDLPLAEPIVGHLGKSSAVSLTPFFLTKEVERLVSEVMTSELMWWDCWRNEACASLDSDFAPITIGLPPGLFLSSEASLR